MAFAVRCRDRLESRCLEAPVAQLDRALPSEGRGRGFESLRVRQIPAYKQLCAQPDAGRVDPMNLRARLLINRFNARGHGARAESAAGFVRFQAKTLQKVSRRDGVGA
jgi:hypothetical protein